MNKEEYFQFYMNERYWKIYIKSQQEMKDYYNEDNSEYYYGQTHFITQEIWLSDDVPDTQLDKTLFHELMHCYLWSYMHNFDEIGEEAMCDISANSHDIIHEIVEKYFKDSK